jgi:hypothetical protein
LLDLTSKITRRDIKLLHLLFENRVLTIHQITDLLFESASVARRRMLKLYRMSVLDRFQPPVPTGSAPLHYVLAHYGARILAADRGIDYRELGFRKEDTEALPWKSTFAHLVATNGFMSTLARACRTTPGYEFVQWMSERECRREWGEIVYPDGYARINTPEGPISLFLELDLATEPPGRVAAKLNDYPRLAELSDRPDLLAFCFPDPAREASVRQRLYPPGGILVVTTSIDRHEDDPLGSNWLPTGSHTRQNLTELVADAARERERA